MINEKQVKKEIKKLVRRIKKEQAIAKEQSRTQPKRAIVGLREICVSYGKPEYLIQIRNRMFAMLGAEGGEVLDEFVHIDLDDMSNIIIDKDSLLVWKGLLSDYFSDDYLTRIMVSLLMAEKGKG